MPLLLLSYSFNTQALSATSANTIQGTAPYLTLDGGVTKATTTDLLSITLSDTTTTPATKTTITASGNTSTAASPYVLPVAGQTFADVDMLVPVGATTIGLNALIGAPNNYWGDDDGDGQGTGGVSATGNLSVAITDNNNQTVNRSDALDSCNAPYKVVLTSSAGTLSTLYGAPNSSSLSTANATYYIKPAGASVCFAKPNMDRNYAGPATMWNTTKGFITQSFTPASYGNNFPTTGANGLYFDLDIVDSATALTWTTVADKGITVAPDPATPITATSVRYKLTGPTTAPPTGAFSTTGATFELEGKSGGITVAKYGFTIKKWYIPTNINSSAAILDPWCTGLGYRLSKVNDLTNVPVANWGNPGLVLGGNAYSRQIGTGFFAEWGDVRGYGTASFTEYYYTTIEALGAFEATVSIEGSVTGNLYGNLLSVCTTP